MWAGGRKFLNLLLINDLIWSQTLSSLLFFLEKGGGKLTSLRMTLAQNRHLETSCCCMFKRLPSLVELSIQEQKKSAVENEDISRLHEDCTATVCLLTAPKNFLWKATERQKHLSAMRNTIFSRRLDCSSKFSSFPEPSLCFPCMEPEHLSLTMQGVWCCKVLKGWDWQVALCHLISSDIWNVLQIETVDGSEIRLTSWYGKYAIIYGFSYMSNG